LHHPLRLRSNLFFQGVSGDFSFLFSELAMITIVAILTIREAQAFEQFERQAATIMEAHGGRIDSAFRPGNSSGDENQGVDEIHVVKFPDHEAFNSYRKDERLLALGALRERAISHSTVHVSAQEMDYSLKK